MLVLRRPARAVRRSSAAALTALLVLSLGAPSWAAVTPRFVVPIERRAGTLPSFVRVADLDDDAVSDVVVADQTFDAGVTALLGNGRGGLSAPVRTPLPDAAGSVHLAVARLDVDPHIDLAVVTISSAGYSLAILLGNGDGSFALSEQITAPARRVVAGDIDHDGDVDLAASVATTDGDAIEVRRNRGNGTFGQPRTYRPPFRVSVSDLALRDVDSDGAPDLVYLTGCPVVRLNSGNGTFGPEICSTDPEGRLSGVAFTLADFDGDSAVDIAVADASGGHATIALGSGDGHFAFKARYGGLGAQANWITSGDFTGDGLEDIAVAANGDIAVLLRGNGDGTFANRGRWVSGGSGLTRGDIDGDGSLDLVSAGGLRQDEVSVALNMGDGRFRAPRDFVTEGQYAPGSIVRSGDIDGDGRRDVVVAVFGSPVVHLNLGQGRFGPPVPSPGFSEITGMSIADVDEDGHDDLVASAYQPGVTDNVFVMLGDGEGRLGPPATYSNGSSGAVSSIAVGDVDGDPALDIVTNGPGMISVLPGNGDGTFGEPVLSGTGSASAEATLVADFTGDGTLDVVVATQSGTNDNARSTVYLNRGKGDGTFSLVSTRLVDTNVHAGAAGDLDGDLDADAVIVGIRGSHTGRTGVFRLLAAGGRLRPANYAAGGWNDIALADLNGDRRLDAASVCPSLAGGCLAVNINNGTGGFGRPIQLPTAWDPVSVTADDFTGDGRADIVELLSPQVPSTFALFVNATR